MKLPDLVLLSLKCLTPPTPLLNHLEFNFRMEGICNAQHKLDNERWKGIETNILFYNLKICKSL